MSHITVVESKIKFDNKNHLINALNQMKNKHIGMTFEESTNGKIIQVHYEKIDAPVQSWHPEGNLRFNLKSDGTWEMSGDSYGCWDEERKHNLYTEMTNDVKVYYQESGVYQWSNINGMSTSTTTDEQKNLVVIAQEW